MRYTSLFALVGALVLPIAGSPISPRDNITRDATSYSAASVGSHNTYRQSHSAANLTWDDALADYAATTASKCVLGIDESPGGGGYGQNFDIQGSTTYQSTDSPDTFAGLAVTGWYSQETSFAADYGNPSPPAPASDKEYRSFTQVVWKGSQKLGCASHFCAQGTIPSFSFNSWVTVCNYSPAGNVGGQYADNVSPS